MDSCRNSSAWLRCVTLLTFMAVAAPLLADPPYGMMNDEERKEMMGRYQQPYKDYDHMGMGMMGGWGGGMMGGWGGMGMMGGMGPMAMLELSDKQRDQLGEIQRGQRKQQFELMSKMMDAMQSVEKLMAAEKRDPKAIGKAYEPVFVLRRQMIELMVEGMNRMEAVLNKEQLQEWRKFRHRGMGYGMMGY